MGELVCLHPAYMRGGPSSVKLGKLIFVCAVLPSQFTTGCALSTSLKGSKCVLSEQFCRSKGACIIYRYLWEKNLCSQLKNPCDLLMNSFCLGMSISWKKNHTRTVARVNHKAIRCNQTRSWLKAYRSGNIINTVPPDGTMQTYFKPYHGPINTSINFNLIYFICLQIIWNILFYLKIFPLSCHVICLSSPS